MLTPSKGPATKAPSTTACAARAIHPLALVSVLVWPLARVMARCRRMQARFSHTKGLLVSIKTKASSGPLTLGVAVVGAVPLFLAVVLVADTTVSRMVLRREAGGMPSCRFTAPTTPASPSPVKPQ